MCRKNISRKTIQFLKYGNLALVSGKPHALPIGERWDDSEPRDVMVSPDFLYILRL